MTEVIRRPGQNACIFGLRGSGKSTLARQLMQSYPRVLIVDPHREHGRTDPRVHYTGAVEIGSLEQLVEYLGQTQGRWRIAYFNTALEQEFPRLCALAWELGDCLFVVEEVDRFCGPGRISPEFFDIVNYGRHAPGPPAPERPVDYLTISRYPAAVHIAVRSQAYEIYCFTMNEPAHVEYIAEVAGKEFAGGLQTLPPHHYRFLDLYDRRVGWRDVELGVQPRSLPS